MQSGDLVELKIQTKGASGGAYATAFFQPFPNVQSPPLVQSFHIFAPYGCKATLKQTIGTGRTYEWFLIRADG